MWSVYSTTEHFDVTLHPNFSIPEERSHQGVHVAEGSPTVQRGQSGDFVLVKYNTKKFKKMFVAQILQVESNGDEMEVSFLRKVGSGKAYIFPETEDKAWIDSDQAVPLLPKPVFDNRNQCIFENEQ